MNSRDLKISHLELIGNYGFDGGENIEISDSKLITKDAFWNCRNITVKNSYISGEYFGWNSENIVMENCTLESLQGMCYIKGLVMKNCKLIDTTLSFEYSEVDATIEGHIDSVKNPSSGGSTRDRSENSSWKMTGSIQAQRSLKQMNDRSLRIETDLRDEVRF